MSNYHEGKAIYISGSVLFMSLEDSTKLPAMVLAWENFQEVFVMLVVVVVFLPHWRFFISLLFDIIPHPSVDYRRVFTPILYFQPSPSQSDSRHFHFQPFRYLLTASATVLSGHFLPTGVFYLTLLPDIFGIPNILAQPAFIKVSLGAGSYFLESCRASY